jgi:hypothetical protein
MLTLSDVNSRMRDYDDVFTLSRSFDFEGSLLRDTLQQILEQLPSALSITPDVLSDGFADNSTNQTLWSSFQKHTPIAENISFADIIQGINTFYSQFISRSSQRAPS